MATPLSPGRMIRKDVSRSRGIASLTPEAMALFCLLIPHYSSHGKLNGEPMFIKGEVCPLVPYLDLPTIERCLKEISEKTNVDWFEGPDNCMYLHSLNFSEHQALRKDKIGVDRLPSSPKSKSRTSPVPVPEKSRTSPGDVPSEVEVEVGSVSVSGSKKLKLKPDTLAPGALEAPAHRAPVNGNNGGGKTYPLTTDQAVSKAVEMNDTEKAVEYIVEKSGASEGLARQLLGVYEPPDLGNARKMVQDYINRGNQA